MLPSPDRGTLSGVDLRLLMRFLLMSILMEVFIMIYILLKIEIFEGRDNIITMNQTHSKKFHCTYLIHYYPFDTQVSPIIIKINIIKIALYINRFATCISC